MRGLSVLVTGADGFIGSHLVELLVHEGANVRALVQYNSFNHWGWLEDSSIKDDIEVIMGDVRDPFLCQNLTENIDTVFHLAALIAIPYSYKAPASYIDTNINGTVNICQAALHNGCRRLIQTSTSEVYGTAQFVPITELHPLQAQSPYSASKIGADAMAMSFYNAFDLPLTIARPFNVYGPRQSARAVIPTIITQLANDIESVRLGETQATRDFTYVADTCRALVALACSDTAIGETVNIGSNYEISIEDLFNTIKEIMQRNAEIVTDKQRMRPENSEVYRLWCDNTKLNILTDFKPEYSIHEGLVKTCQWFTDPENLKKYKSKIYNI